MLLQISEQIRIEDPRQYGSEAVNNLRNLLLAGGCGQRDPHRENFYEIENEGQTFYIHVSPINGEVVLLAKWSKSPKENCLLAAPMSAC
jgi:hypothetical protein